MNHKNFTSYKQRSKLYTGYFIASFNTKGHFKIKSNLY